MADWIDAFHEALEFERGLLGLGKAPFRKPQILMTKQQWEDICAYNAMDAEVSAAMAIAEDDRRAGWPTGSKPTRTSLNLVKCSQSLYGKSFVRSLGSVRSSLRNLRTRIDQALRPRR
jgi:hypothetical protein